MICVMMMGARRWGRPIFSSATFISLLQLLVVGAAVVVAVVAVVVVVVAAAVVVAIAAVTVVAAVVAPCSPCLTAQAVTSFAQKMRRTDCAG